MCQSVEEGWLSIVVSTAILGWLTVAPVVPTVVPTLYAKLKPVGMLCVACLVQLASAPADSVAFLLGAKHPWLQVGFIV